MPLVDTFVTVWVAQVPTALGAPERWATMISGSAPFGDGLVSRPVLSAAMALPAGSVFRLMWLSALKLPGVPKTTSRACQVPIAAPST